MLWKRSHWNKKSEQAGAELGQAQLKLELDFNHNSQSIQIADGGQLQM